MSHIWPALQITFQAVHINYHSKLEHFSVLRGSSTHFAHSLPHPRPSQIAKLEQDSGDSEDSPEQRHPPVCLGCPHCSILYSRLTIHIHIHFEAPGHSTQHIPLYIMLICDHFLLLLLLAPINDGSWRHLPSLIGVNIGPDTLALVSKLCRKCDNKAFYPEPGPPRG